ncbi:uncharacterized protein LOC125959774 isoform X2 [Anopheles darlingi]|uniref:uncharacterized protein LOC125959774 isoform X2 n=1 Tax=Anopheles darlingi TaxID=43151 RepID=UPI00210018B2|nr:uncharacterized protein LOC125959774 isoform X2 [Anopheles darlingi]
MYHHNHAFAKLFPNMPKVIGRFSFEVNSVFDEIRPVYRASKIMGIFLDTIDYEKQEIIRTTQDQVILVCAVSLDLYALKVSISQPLQYSDSILLNAGMYCSVILGFLVSLCVPLCNRFFGRRIHRVFKTLYVVDTVLLENGYKMNHQLNLLISCIYLSIPILTNVLLCFTAVLLILSGHPVSQLGVLDFVVFLRSSLAFTIFGTFSCIALTSIYVRFKALNNVIRKKFTSNISDSTLTKNTEDDANIISSIRCYGEIHEKLCDAVQDFNHCFSLQILCMMASAFGFTLFSIFGIIHDFSQLTAEMDHNVTFNNIVYGAIYLSFIVTVVITGSLVSSEKTLPVGQKDSGDGTQSNMLSILWRSSY